jgi:hypothetical protein
MSGDDDNIDDDGDDDDGDGDGDGDCDGDSVGADLDLLCQLSCGCEDDGGRALAALAGVVVLLDVVENGDQEPKRLTTSCA